MSFYKMEQNYKIDIVWFFLQESDSKKKESMDVSEPPTAVAS